MSAIAPLLVGAS